MSSPERLMGIGMAPELAKRVGFFTISLSSANQTINGPGNFFIQASVSFTLGSGFDVDDTVIVAAAGGSDINVTPDSASRISTKTTASAAVVTSGFCRTLYRFSQTQWWQDIASA